MPPPPTGYVAAGVQPNFVCNNKQFDRTQYTQSLCEKEMCTAVQVRVCIRDEHGSKHMCGTVHQPQPVLQDCLVQDLFLDARHAVTAAVYAAYYVAPCALLISRRCCNCCCSRMRHCKPLGWGGEQWPSTLAKLFHRG